MSGNDRNGAPLVGVEAPPLDDLEAQHIHSFRDQLAARLKRERADAARMKKEGRQWSKTPYSEELSEEARNRKPGLVHYSDVRPRDERHIVPEHEYMPVFNANPVHY